MFSGSVFRDGQPVFGKAKRLITFDFHVSPEAGGL